MPFANSTDACAPDTAETTGNIQASLLEELGSLSGPNQKVSEHELRVLCRSGSEMVISDKFDLFKKRSSIALTVLGNGFLLVPVSVELCHGRHSGARGAQVRQKRSPSGWLC